MNSRVNEITLQQQVELYSLIQDLHGCITRPVDKWLALEERFFDKWRTKNFNDWRKRSLLISNYTKHEIKEWVNKQNELTN